jgi:hypothetical protein
LGNDPLAEEGTEEGKKKAKESDMRRRRIAVLRTVLDSWRNGKARAWTVVKIADEVLAPKGPLEIEGLLDVKAALLKDVCEVTASHSSFADLIFPKFGPRY